VDEDLCISRSTPAHHVDTQLPKFENTTGLRKPSDERLRGPEEWDTWRLFQESSRMGSRLDHRLGRGDRRGLKSLRRSKFWYLIVVPSQFPYGFDDTEIFLYTSTLHLFLICLQNNPKYTCNHPSFSQHPTTKTISRPKKNEGRRGKFFYVSKGSLFSLCIVYIGTVLLFPHFYNYTGVNIIFFFCQFNTGIWNERGITSSSHLLPSMRGVWFLTA